MTLHELEGSTRPLVNRVIDGLESGEFRVAEPDGQGGWKVNEWLKKAVLLYFRVNDMAVVDARPAPFWDKVESRFAGYDEAKFRRGGVRVVPGAIARRGTYFGKDVVLMPSFTNIGAYVGEGTMVDTWATVGSCAQIGQHCHLSGGAGIGGVLEPLQASPTIIEDHCFIGARSEVVEGVVVGHHSVIGMGVFLSQSTRIYNRATGEISYGYIPPYSVVVSGSLPSKDGTHSLYCAVIVKQVDAKTRSKTSVNDCCAAWPTEGECAGGPGAVRDLPASVRQRVRTDAAAAARSALDPVAPGTVAALADAGTGQRRARRGLRELVGRCAPCPASATWPSLRGPCRTRAIHRSQLSPWPLRAGAGGTAALPDAVARAEQLALVPAP